MIEDAKEFVQNRINLAACYRRVFNSPDGERVLKDLMKRNNIIKSCFVRNDPNETLINEGKRLSVLAILRLVKGDVQKLKLIMEVQEDD